MTDFIYEMPCLGAYEFNIHGECKRKDKKVLMRTYDGYIGHEKVWKCETHYYLKLDTGNYERIRVKEVKQYIKHCDFVLRGLGVIKDMSEAIEPLDQLKRESVKEWQDCEPETIRTCISRK